MENNIHRISDVLKALSDKTRLKIIKQLLSSNKLCVGIIAKELNVTQPAISQHMKILRHAGIVSANKVGFYTHYSINEETISAIKSDLDAFLQPTKHKTCKKCPKSLKMRA